MNKHLYRKGSKVYVAIKGNGNRAFLFEGKILTKYVEDDENMYLVKFLESEIDCCEKDLWTTANEAKEHLAIDNEFLKQIKEDLDNATRG